MPSFNRPEANQRSDSLTSNVTRSPAVNNASSSAWTKLHEKEFDTLATAEAVGSINPVGRTRLRELNLLRNATLFPRSPEELAAESATARRESAVIDQLSQMTRNISGKTSSNENS